MESTYKFIYKNQKPFIIKLIGLMMILIAIVKIMHTPIFGIVLGLMSTGIFVYQRGVEVNFTDRTYRYFTSFGPQVFGEWKELGNIEYVSVFAATYASSVTGISSTKVTSRQQLIEVNLIHSRNQKINVNLTRDTEEAFETARQFSAALSLRIYDATTRERKWLDVFIKK